MNYKNKQHFRERFAGTINPENPLIRGILIQTIELANPEGSDEEPGGGAEVLVKS